MKKLEAGITYEIERIVTPDVTAEAFGSGEVKVFATPIVILSMEQAAYFAVQDYLEDGAATVGTKVNIEHIAATPEGMKVRTKATLTEVDGRRLLFDVEAWDEKELIAVGKHERFIIYKEKFMAKANSKLDK